MNLIEPELASQCPSQAVSEIQVLPELDSDKRLGPRALQKTYIVKIPEQVVRNSKDELIEKSKLNNSKYTPGRESRPEEFPHSAELTRWLADLLLEPCATDLSFVRAVGERDSIFADNLHFDSRYVGFSRQRNIKGSFWRPSNSVEIWRQIINLDDKPRHLQIVNTPIKQLEERQIDIYKERPVGRYIVGYDDPKDIPLSLLTKNILPEESQVYEIPAYDGENLSVLELWSSQVLHAGITVKSGQHMAAAAKWVEPGKQNGGGYYAK